MNYQFSTCYTYFKYSEHSYLLYSGLIILYEGVLKSNLNLSSIPSGVALYRVLWLCSFSCLRGVVCFRESKKWPVLMNNARQWSFACQREISDGKYFRKNEMTDEDRHCPWRRATIHTDENIEINHVLIQKNTQGSLGYLSIYQVALKQGLTNFR